MKLAIISHTKHYLDQEGNVMGWGPTVREINYLLEVFEVIYHVAPLHNTLPPPSSFAYSSKKIHFIPLRPSGGTRITDKFQILTSIPHNLKVIEKTLREVDIVQLRLPTNIGLYVLPYLSFFTAVPRWVKYAGNWKQESPPLSYRIQRWWLKNNFQQSKVTINGKWNEKKHHLVSFENPCISNEELVKANDIAKDKNFADKLSICFVGRVEEAKGVERLLKAVAQMEKKDQIEKVYIVGDGPNRSEYENLSKSCGLDVIFTGPLSRLDLNRIYEVCHIFCLPSSASEGFPKVIAEAVAYGCVPVVSSVSSIGHYINSENGVVLQNISPGNIAVNIDKLFVDRVLLKKLASKALYLSSKFTFEYYNKRISTDVLNIAFRDE